MSGEPRTSGIDLNPHHEDIRANRDTFDFIRAGYRWPGIGIGNRCANYTPESYVHTNSTQLVSDDPRRDNFITYVDCGQVGVSKADSNAFSAETSVVGCPDCISGLHHMTRVYNEALSVRWTGFLSPLESGYYAFIINASDGVRVFLDGIMLDKWVWYVARDFRFSSGRPKSAAEAGLTLPSSLLAVFCILTTQGRSRGGIQAAWHHASVV